MFCKHKWKVVDKTVLPSAFEQAKSQGLESCEGVSPSFFTKTALVIVACEHCGKLKRFTERNP